MLTNVIPSLAQPCDHPDYEPLVALYEATDGDNWTTSWDLSNCDVCSHFGITCDESRRVTRIDLDGNNLTGFIPSEIGEIENLEDLFLKGNNLSGSIPSNIGRLINLTVLQLTSNQLSGPIPSEIGNLIQLADLRFDNNALSGALPESLGNLKKIIFLNLSQNDLTGNIPSSLGNLCKGEFLLLEDNNLSGSLPKELSSLGNQREINPNARGGINVANNNLSGCYPIEYKAFCRIDFGLIVDGNENLSDFSEFCFFENNVCDTTEISCDNLQFVSDSNKVVITGLSTASKVEIIGRNTDYQTIVICDGDCQESQAITDLQSGGYAVKVNLFDGDNYCYREELLMINGDTPVSGIANCSQLIFTGEGRKIIVDGLTANYNKVEIIGRNTDWQVIPICDGDCPPTLSIPDLESGEYAVKVNQSGSDGSFCYREELVIIGNNTNDTADCDKLNFIAGNGEIIIEGLTASYDKVEIIGRNTDWQVITFCNGDCADTQIISDLAAGEYSVKVNQGGSDDSYCYREQKVQLENSSSNRNGELNFADNLVLYPNPAKDRIHLQLSSPCDKEGSIQIYNAFGQVIQSFYTTRFDDDVVIDLNGYENGFYLMAVRIDELPQISHRFVVEHLK